MSAVAWIVVAALSFFSGGFAIPIGFSLGLSALEVYLAATAGSMAGLAVFLFAGDKVRHRLSRGRPERVPAQDSQVAEFAERYGPRGLGLVGPIFPGVTASVLIGLALGMNRAALASGCPSASPGCSPCTALGCGCSSRRSGFPDRRQQPAGPAQLCRIPRCES